MRTQILTLLVKKDIKDLLKNMSILPILLIGPFLAYFMSKVTPAGPVADALPMWILYGIAMVGIMIPGFTVSEEKEKATLDSLLVSPATSNEIIMGKVIYTLLAIIIVTFLTIMPNGGLIGNQLIVWLGAVLGAIFFIQIGLIIGLFTKNQVSAGAFMTPVMLLFILVPVATQFAPSFIKTAIEYSPSLNIMTMARTGLLNHGLSEIWKHIILLFVWNIVAFIFTRKGFKHQFQ